MSKILNAFTICLKGRMLCSLNYGTDLKAEQSSSYVLFGSTGEKSIPPVDATQWIDIHARTGTTATHAPATSFVTIGTERKFKYVIENKIRIISNVTNFGF